MMGQQVTDLNTEEKRYNTCIIGVPGKEKECVEAWKR